MMFLLQCPKCKNRMKYSTKDRILTKKSKRCVYCGRNFNVKNNIIKRIEK